MKKNIFFQKALLCLLMIVPYLNYGQTVITYPAANAVFQATDVNPDANVVDNKATVYFAGQSDEATTGSFGNLFYKLEKKDNQGNWSIYASKNDIAITSSALNSFRKGFFFNINDLPKAWYRLTIYRKWNLVIFTIRRNRDTKEFGVGDVYFVAGQSNASGYKDFNEDDLEPYYNTGTMNNMARVIRFDGDQSKVSKVLGVDQTPNDQESIKKGLPYNTDANSIFAFSQFENGTSQTNLRAIYPNGVASWSWSILANKIANENQTPTLFFNMAEPNTSLVLDWWGYPTPFGFTKTYNGNTVSTLKGKFHETLKTYGNLLGAKAVLWHQGEADCAALGYVPNQYPIGEYQTKLGNLIDLSRQALNDGTNKKLSWYVSKVSYATGGNNWSINGHTGPTSLNPAAGRIDITSKYTHNGLKNVQFNNSNERIYQGVETDDNGEGERASRQRIHFSGSSLETLANEWKTAIYNSYSNEAVTATPLLQLTSVTRNSGSSYSLTVNSPGRGSYSK